MHEELAMQAKRIVGMKQVLRALEKDALQTVFIAKDADDFIYRRVLNAADAHHANVIRIETMKELGQLCKVDVKTAVAGILR